eukprot:TRINITY_DN2822_c0_g1_i1.p1 TRINITY_DN2822_c0_g1~~TRINITY_DN2822_c0_g1_i1.p1  ORF type:complete len:344 (-),score=54.31 TRINITY_DN2822_c0_g1_i1:129-1160(-)
MKASAFSAMLWFWYSVHGIKIDGGLDRPAWTAPHVTLAATGERQKHLAVLITGVADRFVWESTVQRMARPAIAQGYSVDFYVRLVAHGHQNAATFTEISDGSDSQVKMSAVRQGLRRAGANLVSLEILQDLENVSADMPNNTKPFKRRLYQYSPFTSKTGRNVVRKLQSVQSLMTQAVLEERSRHFHYDFIMVSREDSSWLSPLDMRVFEGGSQNQTHENRGQNKVFTKNCLSWRTTGPAVNDKIFVFGREAAEKVLTRLYSDFWNTELAPSLNAYNAEEYWAAYIKIKGAQSAVVDPIQLPTSDTKWQRGKPCLVSRYHCQANYEQKPPMCEGETRHDGNHA